MTHISQNLTKFGPYSMACVIFSHYLISYLILRLKKGRVLGRFKDKNKALGVDILEILFTQEKYVEGVFFIPKNIIYSQKFPNCHILIYHIYLDFYEHSQYCVEDLNILKTFYIWRTEKTFQFKRLILVLYAVL